MPLPNVGGYYYQASPNQHSRENQGTVRVDHTFNDHNTFTGYYYVDDGFDENPFTRFQAVTNNLLPGFGSNNATRNQQINLSDTWTLSPTTQNEARITYYREGQLTFLAFQRTGVSDGFLHRGGGALLLQRQSGHAARSTTTEIRLPRQMPKLGHYSGPAVQTARAFLTSTSAADSRSATIQKDRCRRSGNTYSLTDNFSKVIGQHSMKFGGDFRIQRFDQTLVLQRERVLLLQRRRPKRPGGH